MLRRPDQFADVDKILAYQDRRAPYGSAACGFAHPRAAYPVLAPSVIRWNQTGAARARSSFVH